MGWQWTPEAWAGWAKSLRENWSQSLSDAWEDTQRAIGAEVQAAPTDAQARAEKMHRDLFATSDDPGGPGIWWNIGYQWGLERQLAPDNPERLYQGLAQKLGVPASELTGDAAARRAQVLTLGLLKGATPKSGSQLPGFVPLIIGGMIVLSFGAACWAWVRHEQAQVELDRTALSREALQAQVEASKDGRQLDTAAVAKIVGAAAAPQPSGSGAAGGGSGTLLMVGGVVVIVGLGAFLYGKR